MILENKKMVSKITKSVLLKDQYYSFFGISKYQWFVIADLTRNLLIISIIFIGHSCFRRNDGAFETNLTKSKRSCPFDTASR